MMTFIFFIEKAIGDNNFETDGSIG